jgi:hypothetical protein
MPSGTNFCIEDRCGIHFWGVHSHDAMWHLEIASVAFKTFPFQVPTFSGEVLSGYNTLMAYSLYLLSFIGIHPSFTLFKIIPPLWFILYTIIGIRFARLIYDKFLFVLMFLGTIYFADSFGYVIALYHHGSIFGGAQSFLMQSISYMLNPQLAISMPLILWQLIILKREKYNTRSALTISILFFVILGLKFYGGVLSALICGFFIFEMILKKEKYKKILMNSFLIALAGLLSIILFYNPFEAGKTGSIFTFSPFATVHSVIEAPNMVYLPDMVNARYFLYEAGWSPRLLFIELFSTFLYFVINFGTRVFGVAYIIYKLILKKVSRFEIYIFLSALVMFLLNISLIQKGDWWNTVQFGYYSIFLSNVFLSILLFDFLVSKSKVKLALFVLIILITIPSNLRILRIFAAPDTSYISRKEVEALNFLKEKPYGVVFNSFESVKGYTFLDYKNSGYISAYSNKPLYLAHLGPLNIIGIDSKEREKKVLQGDCKILEEVDYVYIVNGHDLGNMRNCFELEFLSNKIIFKNEEVLVLEL